MCCVCVCACTHTCVRTYVSVCVRKGTNGIVCMQCVCIHFCSDLRYKEEIMQYLEKDKAVKQERAQLELEHQMRLEEVERNICQQNETFIKELSSAKEKVPHTAVVLFIRLNFQLH